MDAASMGSSLTKVLLSEEQILARLEELAGQIWADYAGKDLLLVGVLKGAVLVMADLMRAMPGTVRMDWMAVSSYGSGTKSSGVVRIIKDLDTDITDKHVLVVEDIIDSGLTLSWIRANLSSRKPASVEICALLRKPEVAKVAIEGEPPSPVLPPAGCRFHTRCLAASDACRRDEPELREVGRDHFVACHHPLVAADPQPLV